MLYAIVAVLALILDQAVKYWTTVNIVVDTGEAKLIPGFVHLANVHNTGAAFSFLEGARWFFVILCIIFCLVVIYVLAKNIITHPVARWCAVLVMAGAIGNCIDRIVCGYVVDMFEFDFLIFGKPFPVFNLADIYITVGVIVFCICILVDKPKAAKKNVPYAEGQAAAEETRQRKPIVARRQRTPIPDFPKRDHAAEPALDPNDPFAEWETNRSTVYTQPDKAYSPDAVDFVNTLAGGPAVAAAEPEPVKKPEPAPVQKAEPAQKPQPAPVQKAEPAPAPKTFEAPPAAAPVRPAPEAPKAPERPADFEAAPAPAAPPVTYPAPAANEQTEADNYNLDDILAEFRDL